MKHIRIYIVAIALLFVARTAHATILYVHPDSTFNCIQDCLDSCANGDTVLVGPGVYHENIVWPNMHGIHLIGELGPDTTIIDGDSAGRVIQISTGTDSATLISGFTVRNGYLTGIYDHGAGIYCENSSPTIANNIITGNSRRRRNAPSEESGTFPETSSPGTRTATSPTVDALTT